MSKIFNVISGIGILIAIFLFLNNRKATVDVINSISGNAVKGIKTLQGR